MLALLGARSLLGVYALAKYFGSYFQLWLNARKIFSVDRARKEKKRRPNYVVNFDF